MIEKLKTYRYSIAKIVSLSAAVALLAVGIFEYHSFVTDHGLFSEGFSFIVLYVLGLMGFFAAFNVALVFLSAFLFWHESTREIERRLKTEHRHIFPRDCCPYSLVEIVGDDCKNTCEKKDEMFLIIHRTKLEVEKEIDKRDEELKAAFLQSGLMLLFLSLVFPSLVPMAGVAFIIHLSM